MNNKDRILRWAAAAAGTSIAAICCGMLSIADFGMDPCQCFCMGTHIPFGKLGLSYGYYWPMVTAVFLIFVFFMDKHYIGFGTLVNLVISGYLIDWTKAFIISFTGENPAFWIRILLLLSALFIMCFSASMYFMADQGVSAYDGIALTLSDRKLSVFGRVIPFRIMRIITDSCCVLIGFLFGLKPGIGTILTAFCMGPLIDWFNRHVFGKVFPKRRLSLSE